MTDNARGALLLVIAAAVFTADVTVLRFLSDGVNNAQVVFFRALVQLVVVLVWILSKSAALLWTKRPGLLLSRGLTSLVCWWLYYASFQALDLALATTLTFTTSLFVVALAPLVLGEKVGKLRWAATLGGFLGVAFASGASPADVAPGVWLGLGSSIAAAVLIFQNRVLARTEHTATIMLWIGAVASIGTAPGAILGWTAIALPDLGLLIAAGTLGTLGMLLTIEAYRVGEVSALAPYPYMRVVFAPLAGWLLFSETMATREVIGAALIIACGLLAGGRMARRPKGV